MRKKWWIVASVVIVIAGIAFVGNQLNSRRQELAIEAQTSVETAVVRQDTLVVTVEGTGNLTPNAEVSLAFLSGGQVAEILVEEGQVVDAGQSLVRLETDELEFQAARAEAMLASATAQLAQLLAPPRSEEVMAQEANLAATQGQVSAAAASRDQIAAGPSEAEIAAVKAQIAAAELDHRLAVINYDRTDKKDEEQKEQSRYDLWAAEIALKATQTQLDVLLDGPDPHQVRAAQANVNSAEAQSDAAQAQLDLLLAGATTEQLQATEAAVAQASVALEQARLSLGQATLIAPMDGTVTALNVALGEMIGPSQPVILLSSLAILEVNVYLDETDVGQVAVGQEATVEVDAFPEVELPGEVVDIAPVAEVQSGVVLIPITIRLALTDLPVRAGMTADVEIIIANQAEALLVPLRAIKSEDDHTYVERLTGDQTERVEVTLGMMTDTEVGITAGLSEGDVVSIVAEPTRSRDRGFGPPEMFGGDGRGH